MLERVSCLALAITLAGCSLAPKFIQPTAPVYDRYSAQPAGTRLAPDIGWEDYFGDARLRVFIAAALANNRDRAAALARIAQARARYRITQAERLPQFDGQASATRARTPLVGVAGASAGAGAGAAGGATAPTSFTGNQYDASVGVSAFELDLWGRVFNLSVAARAEYLATVAGERAFRLSLISNVAATYLSLRAGEERIALAQRTVARRREGVDIARMRLEGGVTSSIDFDQTVTLLTTAQTELAEVQRTTAQDENYLLVLTGGPVTAPLPQPRPIADPAQFNGIDAGLPSALLIDRPDIQQAEQTLRAADANIGVARAALFPSISLTGAFGSSSGALGDLFKGASRAWSFGGLLDLPIFDWGRRRAEIGRTRAVRDEAVANYQRTIQTAFREVSDGLIGRQRYAEQIAGQVDAVAAQRRLAETARQRYDNGIALYLQVLDAERNLFAAEQQLILLRSQSLQNGVSLYVALGGGARRSSGGQETRDAVDPALRPLRRGDG